MQVKVLWDRNIHDAVCCHSNLPSKNMADFSAEFARQKKRKCLAALVISELLDESEDNLRGKTRAWIRRRSEKEHFNNIVKELLIIWLNFFYLVLHVRRHFEQCVKCFDLVSMDTKYCACASYTKVECPVQTHLILYSIASLTVKQRKNRVVV